MNDEVYRIEITPMKSDVPVLVRLRILLKQIGRYHRFRVVRVSGGTPPGLHQASQDEHGEPREGDRPGQ